MRATPRVCPIIVALLCCPAIGLAQAAPATDSVYSNRDVDAPAYQRPSTCRMPRDRHPMENGRPISGRTLFAFVVDTLGRPDTRSVEVLQAEPEVLAERARAMALSCQWVPAEHGGRKVRVRVTVPISFQFPPPRD